MTKLHFSFNIEDEVIVTENVQGNNTDQNLEATIIDIENNPFRGFGACNQNCG